MKMIPGYPTRKKKEVESKRDETSEEPKETKVKGPKIPKSVMDDPQKHRLNYSMRPISNGFIQSVSYEHPDHGYVNHEFYHETNPLETKE